MKIWSSITLILILSSCSYQNKGGFESKIQSIELEYIAWACDCANWATLEDARSYTGDSLSERCIFIEPSSDRLKLPDTLGWSMDRIVFTGQFYKKPGFPSGFRSPQPVEKSKVFRYTDYVVKVSNYRWNKDNSD